MIKDIIKNKKSKVVSSKEALKDVEYIDWSKCSNTKDIVLKDKNK